MRGNADRWTSFRGSMRGGVSCRVPRAECPNASLKSARDAPLLSISVAKHFFTQEDEGLSVRHAAVAFALDHAQPPLSERCAKPSRSQWPLRVRAQCQTGTLRFGCALGNTTLRCLVLLASGRMCTLPVLIATAGTQTWESGRTKPCIYRGARKRMVSQGRQGAPIESG